MVADKGFLYVATGAKYLMEAEVSARSFRNKMPEVAIAVCTDDTATAQAIPVFDHVIGVADPEFSYVDKIRVLKQSPFQKTVFLDTDTYCLNACEDLFDLLDGVSLAAAHAPIREFGYRPYACPKSFPEFNTGVIAFRNDPAFHELVDDWFAIYRKQTEVVEGFADQPAFREAVYRSSVRFSVLPPEYNLRTCFPYFVGGNAVVSIIHDRGETLERAIRVLTGHAKAKPAIPAIINPAVVR